MGKKLVCMMLFFMMALGAVQTAKGASEKIEKVTLNFSYSPQPKAGETLGSVSAKTSSSQYTVDDAFYVNEVETWTVGDRPLVRVELSARDGYRFYYTSKSHFDLSGCSAEFRRAKYGDDGNSMWLEAYLRQVDGKLNGASKVEWEDTTATWERIEGAKSYEVRLYRDDRTVTVVKISGTAYNLAQYMDKEGCYNFAVRGIADYDDKAGEWSERSDDYYVDEGSLKNAWKQLGWIENQTGWWYSYGNGDYPANCWKFIDSAWYHFDGKGYMQTGWQYLDGNWYYLEKSGAMTTGWRYINGNWYYLSGSGAMLTDWQNINGRWHYLDGSGAMRTGWQNINGNWYYLEESGAMRTGWQHLNGRWYYLDGSGAMRTGWQYINGYWYCLDGSGAMYENTRTPDGFYVDGNGVWLQ